MTRPRGQQVADLTGEAELEAALRDARTPEARSELKARAIRQLIADAWPGPNEGPLVWTFGGRAGEVEAVFDDRPELVRNREGQVLGIDATIRLHRFGHRNNRYEVRIDPHRVLINPPLYEAENVRSDGRRDRRFDPVGAYRRWLFGTLAERPNPRGFRTKGTVTTVYANGSDGHIDSSSAVYATARAGGGTLAVNGAGDTLLDALQLESGGSYLVRQSFLTFDTSTIPPQNDVSDVDLKLLLASGGPPTWTAETIEVYPKDWGLLLETADFVPGASLNVAPVAPLLASLNTSGLTQFIYHTFTESGTSFRDNIVQGGLTKLVLAPASQRTNTAPGAGVIKGERFTSTEQAAGTTNDPILVVTHALPPATSYSEMRVRNQGTRIRVEWNRKRVIDFTDSALSSGTKVGIYAQNASGTVTFDDPYGQRL